MPEPGKCWKRPLPSISAFIFANAERLGSISKGARHQGVVGFIDASKNHVHLEDVLENLQEPPFLLVLDGITDPHNLGACLRTWMRWACMR